MAYVKTPVFNWETPELGNEADVPKDLGKVITQVENTVKQLAVERLASAGAGDSGKLLIVGAGGVPAWKAMSGDATITNAGVISIGGEKVSTAMLAALCVTEAKIALEAIGTGTLKALAVTAAKLAAECVEEGKIKNLAVTAAKIANLTITEGKIADGAVSSQKAKLLREEKVSTENLGPGFGALALIPGLKYEVTPAVTSKLRVIANISWSAGVTTTCYPKGFIYLDGAEVKKAEMKISGPAEALLQMIILKDLVLTPALHTIEIKASCGTGTITIFSTLTSMLTELVAS